MRQIHKKQLLPIGLFAGVLLITLFFGLKPKGYRFVNQVKVNPADSTLVFSNIGMVYSEKTLGELGITDSLTLVMTLEPRSTGSRLQRIATIINQKGKELVCVNQWINGLELIIRDASGNQLLKTWKKNALSSDTVRTCALRITPETVSILSDDPDHQMPAKPVHLKTGFFSECHLSFGLAANGSNPWRGTIRYIALFGTARHEVPSGPIVAPLFSGEISTAATAVHPAAFFHFSDATEKSLPDRSGNGWNLVLPATPKFFKYDLPELLPAFHKINKWSIADILVNFFGFIPFGCCCFLLLRITYPKKKVFFYTILSGLILSMGIEVWQIVIPTRASQLIDVLLNVAGTWAGASGIKLLHNRFHDGVQ